MCNKSTIYMTGSAEYKKNILDKEVITSKYNFTNFWVTIKHTKTCEI